MISREISMSISLEFITHKPRSTTGPTAAMLRFNKERSNLAEEIVRKSFWWSWVLSVEEHGSCFSMVGLGFSAKFSGETEVREEEAELSGLVKERALWRSFGWRKRMAIDVWDQAFSSSALGVSLALGNWNFSVRFCFSFSKCEKKAEWVKRSQTEGLCREIKGLLTCKLIYIYSKNKIKICWLIDFLWVLKVWLKYLRSNRFEIAFIKSKYKYIDASRKFSENHYFNLLQNYLILIIEMNLNQLILRSIVSSIHLNSNHKLNSGSIQYY